MKPGYGIAAVMLAGLVAYGQALAQGAAQQPAEQQAQVEEELLAVPTPEEGIEAAENEASAVEQLAQTREDLGGEIPVQPPSPEHEEALSVAEEMKDDQHAAVDRIQSSD